MKLKLRVFPICECHHGDTNVWSPWRPLINTLHLKSLHMKSGMAAAMRGQGINKWILMMTVLPGFHSAVLKVSLMVSWHPVDAWCFWAGRTFSDGVAPFPLWSPASCEATFLCLCFLWPPLVLAVASLKGALEVHKRNKSWLYNNFHIQLTVVILLDNCFWKEMSILL